MCGIVAAVANKDISRTLLESLKKLEYRGYDSAGLVVLNGDGQLQHKKTAGKVSELITAFEGAPFVGNVGLAHTRWATHGKPNEINAHPHFSHDNVAIVHNGIIENYQAIQKKLIAKGYEFLTETDSEAIVHQIHDYLSHGETLLSSVQKTVKELEGAFALGVISSHAPEQLIVVRKGAPVVIGVASDATYVASDPLALLSATKNFIYLDDGDIALLTTQNVAVYDKHANLVEKNIHHLDVQQDSADKGSYRHFMLKEIMEQPQVVEQTLSGRLSQNSVLEETFGHAALSVFNEVKNVQIVACGTSYHAGLIARYWLESLAGIPCQVEVASEFRYRKFVVPPKTLFVTISQSGETADTLAAMRQAKQAGFLSTLTICNVPQSSLVRESELAFMTQAGIEIGVASTKAFTSQLVALLLLTIALGRRGTLSKTQESALVSELRQLPEIITATLRLDEEIKTLAQSFADKQHALFLGRGLHYPIALEGALKLKEISYIHAEAYPAGELKHGPLALIDKDMPVVAVAPNDSVQEKLKSNLTEVRARAGELFLFVDPTTHLTTEPGQHVLTMPSVSEVLAPIVYTIPLQLLAYHVAVLKGTDVDQPRNLAKSVTVE